MEKFVKDLFDQSDYKNLTLRVIREKYQQKKNIKELSDDQKTKLKRIVEAVFANKLAIETVETGLEEHDIDVEKIKLNTGKHDIKKRKISDDNDTDDDDSPAGVHCNPLPLQAKKKAKISKISSDESIDSDVNLDESDSKEHREEHSQIKKMNSNKRSIISDKDSDSESLNSLNKEDQEESISNGNNETEGQQTFEKNKNFKSVDRDVSDSDDDCEIKDQLLNKKKKNYKSKKSSVNKKQECDDSSSDGSSEIENKRKVGKCKEKKRVKSGKKVKSKRKNEISDENVDSVVISSPNKKDVCGESNSDGGSDVESQQTIKKNKENRSTKNNSKCDEKSKQLKYYEKIARHCRLLPVGARYKATFEFCSNEKDKIEKIKTILKNAGMTGRISMEEAEKLKLRQEAAELNTDNIISLSGRSHRKAKSASTNSFFDCKLSAKSISEEPLKNQLSSLRDIIESDSDD